MLVLSRKKDEVIQITVNGVMVKVTIVRIGPNTVRLGVEAPDEVSIVREELCVSENDDRFLPPTY